MNQRIACQTVVRVPLSCLLAQRTVKLFTGTSTVTPFTGTRSNENRNINKYKNFQR